LFLISNPIEPYFIWNFSSLGRHPSGRIKLRADLKYSNFSSNSNPFGLGPLGTAPLPLSWWPWRCSLSPVGRDRAGHCHSEEPDRHGCALQRDRPQGWERPSQADRGQPGLRGRWQASPRARFSPLHCLILFPNSDFV
jgi:hypothetical protein